MTTSIRSALALGVVACAILAIGSAGASTGAAGDDDDDDEPRLGALVGTWEVTVQLPGAPPARVLATFNDDGTTVESAAAPPATRGASHGVWKRIGRNLFSVTRIFFRFNPQTGTFLGTTKVNATAHVASNRETFEAVSISELRDPAGTLIAGDLRGTATATRVHVETIPDRP